MKTIQDTVRAMHDRGAWRAVDQALLMIAKAGATDILVELLCDERADLRAGAAEALDDHHLRALLRHPCVDIRAAARWGIDVHAHERRGELAGRLMLARIAR